MRMRTSSHTTNFHRTAPLGELVVAAFDRAARLSTDAREVSRLATAVVMRVLHARTTTTPRSAPAPRVAGRAGG